MNCLIQETGMNEIGSRSKRIARDERPVRAENVMSLVRLAQGYGKVARKSRRFLAENLFPRGTMTARG